MYIFVNETHYASVMKKIYGLYLIFLLSLSFVAYAQRPVSFAYDAAGNRVKREIILSRSMPSPDTPDENPENTFFDTLGRRTVKLTGISPNIVKIEILGYEPADDAFAEVYSLGGVRLISQPVKDAVAEIDISAEPAGTYILNVSVNGQRTTWKIAK